MLLFDSHPQVQILLQVYCSFDEVLKYMKWTSGFFLTTDQTGKCKFCSETVSSSKLAALHLEVKI
uniref:Uncharacterized protein n=1 Tax=Physcomitrium patens TaxID=3218 RepID=A0A2K1KH52_PHYPA|nr:hypothetical protein PHYPA_009485 [Physcomitrium patens]